MPWCAFLPPFSDSLEKFHCISGKMIILFAKSVQVISLPMISSAGNRVLMLLEQVNPSLSAADGLLILFPCYARCTAGITCPCSHDHSILKDFDRSGWRTKKTNNISLITVQRSLPVWIAALAYRTKSGKRGYMTNVYVYVKNAQ